MISPSRAGRATLVALRLLIPAACLAPLWFWQGGLLEVETTLFIRQYLDARSVLQKVFDPHGNDFGTYQARELSYLVDYLDARFFKALMANDLVLFVPLSALAASFLTVVVYLVAVRRLSPALSPITRTLVLLLYLSNYVYVVTMGMFYRSTKPLLALVVLGAGLYLLGLNWRPHREVSRGGGLARAGAVVFILFCLMGLLDRQGFFYAGLGLLLLTLPALAGGRRDLPIGAGAAVGVLVLYNLVLAPLIVGRVNVYTPSFEYQALPLGQLLVDQRAFLHAAEMLADAGGALLGGLATWVLAGLLVCGAALGIRWIRRSHDAPVGEEIVKRRWLAGAVCLLVALAHVLMFALMILRHPPVYEYRDHHFWYYPLPFQAVLVIGLVLLLQRCASVWSARRMALVNLVLAAGIISNVLHWTDYRRQMLLSRWFPIVYYQTDALKLSFEDGRPRPVLDTEYFGFYNYCLTLSPELRSRALRD